MELDLKMTMDTKGSVKDLIESNMDILATDFYDVLPDGVLFGFPVDDTALYAFEFTIKELYPYMYGDKQHMKDSYEILTDMLNVRGLL